jgi:hypothetical protein
LFNIWLGMHDRSENPDGANYYLYGARGISVCQEWFGQDGFHRFVAWARENGYADDLTIDRIDNDEGYFPANCHWVSKGEQCQHKRSNKLSIEKAREIRRLWAEGVPKDEIAAAYGVSQSTISRTVEGRSWKSA